MFLWGLLVALVYEMTNQLKVLRDLWYMRCRNWQAVGEESIGEGWSALLNNVLE